MKRLSGWLVTHPFISGLIFVMWLILTSPSLANVVLAVIFALIIPKLTDAFWVAQPKIHRPFMLIKFVFHVIIDIITSNIRVAINILSFKRAPQPGFIFYPLAMQEPFPITLLTSTLSLSPGTLSAHLRPHDNTLLIHALDVDDVEAQINFIYERYERPLKEIFGC